MHFHKDMPKEEQILKARAYRAKYRASHKAEIYAAEKARRATDPTWRERARAAQQRWRAKHPDREPYAGSAEANRAKARRWYWNHRDEAIARAEARRVVEEVGDLTVELWRRIRDNFASMCAYCPAEATSMDHVVPISAGGRHTASNVVPACKSCNSRKSAAPLLTWAGRSAIFLREAA